MTAPTGPHRSLRERTELVDLAAELGPDAPTSCEGWTTRDLVAHLRIREHRLDAAPGLLGKGPFAAHTARVEASAARRPYEELLADLRDGPPWFWPGRWRPDVDLHEWFVHHEDVRRANDLPPRTDPDLDADLAPILGRWGRLLTRRATVGIDLVTPDGVERSVRDGDPRVALRGRPGELLLRLFGRPCEVEVDGSPDAVAGFERSPIGF